MVLDIQMYTHLYTHIRGDITMEETLSISKIYKNLAIKYLELKATEENENEINKILDELTYMVNKRPYLNKGKLSLEFLKKQKNKEYININYPNNAHKTTVITQDKKTGNQHKIIVEKENKAENEIKKLSIKINQIQTDFNKTYEKIKQEINGLKYDNQLLSSEIKKLKTTRPKINYLEPQSKKIIKKSVSIKVKAWVIAALKNHQPQYQTLINLILTEYMTTKRCPTLKHASKNYDINIAKIKINIRINVEIIEYLKQKTPHYHVLINTILEGCFLRDK